MKRFEFIGKTKSTLEDVDIQVLKKGQTETVPAVLLTFLTRQPNTFLDVLDPSGRLRTFCYEKGNPNRATQSTLEGVAPVSDMPFLSESMQKMGAQFDWEYEQTGCKTVIYRGTARDESNIKLKDGTVSKVRVTCMDGGTVHVRHCFYASDLDSETIGDIAVLKKQELEIELTAPELVSQQRSIEDGKKAKTPEQALAESVKGDAKASGKDTGAEKGKPAAKTAASRRGTHTPAQAASVE